MLVLTRRPDQTITVGGEAVEDAPIEVTSLEVRGDQVKIGISAPPETAVDRAEIRAQKQSQDQKQAAERH